METKKPTHRIRRGSLEAAIWTNESKKGSFDRATITRTYKDATGKLATSASFGASELAEVALIAVDAYRWIRDAEGARKAASKAAIDETPESADMPE